MLVYKTTTSLHLALDRERAKGKKIGFVPTMGALHDGHLSLVERSNEENDLTVVSIFVNPTQFNNPDDLKSYPRMPEVDLNILEEANASIVFMPEVSEIYSSDSGQKKIHLDLGKLGRVMEGAFRPGHFEGVVQIVRLLFEIVKPDHAYFGEKDFQQLTVIRFMTTYFNLNVEIVGCPTVREENGLAMSSRNLRLSQKEREDAAVIAKALKFIRDNWKTATPQELKLKAIEQIEKKNFKIEYLEIADEESLEPIHIWNVNQKPRAFAAVFCGPVRLIDNVGLVTEQG